MNIQKIVDHLKGKASIQSVYRNIEKLPQKLLLTESKVVTEKTNDKQKEHPEIYFK